MEYKPYFVVDTRQPRFDNLAVKVTMATQDIRTETYIDDRQETNRLFVT